jgi:hypothetical protein
MGQRFEEDDEKIGVRGDYFYDFAIINLLLFKEGKGNATRNKAIEILLTFQARQQF